MPTQEALAFSLTNGTWSKYTSFATIDAANLTGNTREENTTLLLRQTTSNRPSLMIYPGETLYPSKAARRIKTKRYSLPAKNGSLMMFLLRRIRIEYEGTSVVATITVYNERFPDGFVTTDDLAILNNRWYGLPRNLKGFYFEVELHSPDTIKDIQVELVVYADQQ